MVVGEYQTTENEEFLATDEHRLNTDRVILFPSRTDFAQCSKAKNTVGASHRFEKSVFHPCESVAKKLFPN